MKSIAVFFNQSGFSLLGALAAAAIGAAVLMGTAQSFVQQKIQLRLPPKKANLANLILHFLSAPFLVDRGIVLFAGGADIRFSYYLYKPWLVSWLEAAWISPESLKIWGQRLVCRTGLHYDGAGRME